MKFKDRVVGYDLEATCDNKVDDYPSIIIEIGAVDNKGEEFNTFVKPVEAPILTDYCTELTTIQQSDVDNAPTYPEAHRVFFEYLMREDCTVFSWGAYDKRQIKKEMKQNGLHKELEFIEENFVNLKDFYTEVTGFKAKGMKKTLRKFNIPLDGTHHRGIDDSRNLMKIFEKLIRLEKQEDLTKEELFLISKEKRRGAE